MFWLVVLLVGLFWLRSGGRGEISHEQATKSEASRSSLSDVVLARVKKAAKTKLPGVELDGRESVTFGQLEGGIDELDVMEVLLAVETEFGADVSEKAIRERIGVENRRDYLNHVTIRMLAEIMEESQGVSPASPES